MKTDLLGKKLSTKEIFNQFTDLTVLGEPDSSEYPTIYITIRHIGTPVEMKELFTRKGNRLAIHNGKHSRKGSGVIFGSSFDLSDFVGVWDTSVTADGGMSNEMLVLKSDGTGSFAEANMGPFWETPITWYVEHDVLTICTEDRTICHASIQYERDVIVPCMSGEERHFTALKHAAYGRNFYRDILDRTLVQAEAEAEAGMRFLHNEHNVDSDTGDELIRSALSSGDAAESGQYIFDLLGEE